MLFSINGNFKELTTEELQTLLEKVQRELRNRDLKERQDAMIQLYELIEQIQAKDFNIVLGDTRGNQMLLNHITDVQDNDFEIGYVFGNHPDIMGESPKNKEPEEKKLFALCPFKAESKPSCDMCEYYDICMA